MTDEEADWIANFHAALVEHLAERGPTGPVPKEVVDALLAANGQQVELVELDDDGVNTVTGMLFVSRRLLTGEPDE